MDNMESVKNKVRKLLALGESPNPAEAASALEKANKILIQYNLEMEDCAMVAPEGVTEETFMTGFAARDHETNLVNAIATYNLCNLIIHNRKIYSNGRSKTEFSIAFIGKKSNIVSARIMCEYAFEAMEKSAAKEVKGQGRKAVFSYKVGYCTKLTDKIFQMISYNKKGNGEACTALVVVNDQENKRFMKDNYKNIKEEKRDIPDPKDVFAYMAGQLAASKLGLNQQVRS